MPYYDAPQMLRKQLEYWRMYPAWVKESIRIILVDDGSPNYPAIDVLKDGVPGFTSFELYCIQENIPWNHGGARNLAFTAAEEGWVILTDIDHVLPLETMCSLVTMELSPEVVYIPARFRMRGVLDWEEINRHSDSFILTKKMFWEVGGFDEDFSGYWNGVSGPFRRALKRKAVFSEVDCAHFLLHCNDVVEDASVSLGREGSEYDIKKSKDSKLQKKFSKALHKYKPTNPLRFKWTQVI